MQFSDVLHTLVDFAETAFGAAKQEAHDAIEEMYPKAVSALGERATQVIDGVERYVDDGSVVTPASEAQQPPGAAEEAPSTGESVTGDGTPAAESPGGPPEGATTSPTIDGMPGQEGSSVDTPVPVADPINPTVSSVFDSSGAVVGSIDSTTGEFTPVTVDSTTGEFMPVTAPTG